MNQNNQPKWSQRFFFVLQFYNILKITSHLWVHGYLNHLTVTSPFFHGSVFLPLLLQAGTNVFGHMLPHWRTKTCCALRTANVHQGKNPIGLRKSQLSISMQTVFALFNVLLYMSVFQWGCGDASACAAKISRVLDIPSIFCRTFEAELCSILQLKSLIWTDLVAACSS